MTLAELHQRIKIERNNYDSLKTFVRRVYAFLCHDRDYYVYRYIRLLRYTEFFYERKKGQPLAYIPYILLKSKKNKLGQLLNIDMGEGACDTGLYIAHTGVIVGSASVGKNLKLHGQNCIGSGAVIGDDCELWVGAMVIGPARLADGITVAAGAVVVDDFDEPGITVGGVPARRIK